MDGREGKAGLVLQMVQDQRGYLAVDVLIHKEKGTKSCGWGLLDHIAVRLDHIHLVLEDQTLPDVPFAAFHSKAQLAPAVPELQVEPFQNFTNIPQLPQDRAPGAEKFVT